MSVKQSLNTSYGLNQPLNSEPPFPIASKRAPTSTDYAQIGTIWSDVLTNTVYILASIVANVATWIEVAASGGGTDTFANITVTNSSDLIGTTNITGATTILGTTLINNTGASATEIATAGTGTVSIGNITGGVLIENPVLTGTTSINISGAGVTDINTGISTGAVHIGNNTGDTFIDAGEFTVTNGNIQLTAATAGVIFGVGGPAILAGAGSPNGVTTAAQGSLWLSTTGSSTSTRAFINTNGGTAWTAITTAS